MARQLCCRGIPKLCSDMTAYNGATLEPVFHGIWITMEKSFIKWSPGPRFNIKTVVPGMGIPIIIKRRLIFITGKTALYFGKVPWTKWAPLCTRYFQIHFLGSKFHFNSYFTEMHFPGSNWHVAIFRAMEWMPSCFLTQWWTGLLRHVSVMISGNRRVKVIANSSFLHERPWISPWLKSISNEFDIIFHVLALQLLNYASETRGRCVMIAVFIAIYGIVVSCLK